MFGITIPPGVDVIRLLALSGRRGKPPCIWEGPAATEQSSIEADVSSDPRVRQWLASNRLVQGGVATVNLQIECYSQGRIVDRYDVSGATILMGQRRPKNSVSDQVTLRAFDLVEHMIGEYKELLAERDTVIGRLVERGMREPPAPNASSEAPKTDSLDDLLGKGVKFLAIAQSFKSLRDKN